MLITKNSENVINNELSVDNWTVEYAENSVTGDVDLVETYRGKLSISKTDKQKYLGSVLSCKGDNLANISQIQKKSIGVVQKIISKLESLNLQKYYFKCALILMNVMLRGTILYAC